MELGDRLGIVGIIVAIVALGITILWPTKRWIGYVCFVIAFLLCGGWGVTEYRVHHERAKHVGPSEGTAGNPAPAGTSAPTPQINQTATDSNCSSIVAGRDANVTCLTSPKGKTK
jgi:hypothetical protein